MGRVLDDLSVLVEIRDTDVIDAICSDIAAHGHGRRIPATTGDQEQFHARFCHDKLVERTNLL
jgi:hypothetical protein